VMLLTLLLLRTLAKKAGTRSWALLLAQCWAVGTQGGVRMAKGKSCSSKIKKKSVMQSGMNAKVGVTGLLLQARKSYQLEMTWWIEVLGAVLNYVLKTSVQADGAVRKLSVISGSFQYNWGVTCAVIEVKPPGDCSVFLVTLF